MFFLKSKTKAAELPPASPAPPPVVEAVEQPAVAPVRTTTVTCDLDAGFGHERVTLRLTTPNTPRTARDVRFVEHVVDRSGGGLTDTVICAAHDGVVVSQDLGETWTHIPIEGLEGFRCRNVFTTAEGLHLLQEGEPKGSGDTLRLAVCDADWTLIDVKPLCAAPWHGSRSIDEAGGVIMFAEYPGNYKRGVPNEPDQKVDHDKNSRVFRSMDGGRTWEVIFQIGWQEIRHFHTLIADPFKPGTWWLSSGDHFADCKVWRSDDHGDSWIEVSIEEPKYPAPKKLIGRRQAAYRYTDAVILEDGLIWGADDWLAGSVGWGDPDIPDHKRGGSRMFWAPRGEPLIPEVIGNVGCPIRTMVDVGPAWLITTEAKHLDKIPGAQVMLLSKTRPWALQQVYLAPVLQDRTTGFTYSMASPAVKNGRFFTQRGIYDVFEGGARLLQWDVSFE